MVPGHTFATRASDPHLAAAARALEDEVWGPLGFLSSTAAHRAHYDALLERHADLQLCLVEDATGEPVALANCVPARWDAAAGLPGEGWDWLVGDGGRSSGRGDEILGALAVSVSPRRRRGGLAGAMIDELGRLRSRLGLATLLVPVRPSHKLLHPEVPMRDYAAWLTGEGRCFDPWLRTHLAHGAEVVEVCEASMVVEEDVAFWRGWSDADFPASGSYRVPGALSPIRVDLEADLGRYEEANVWVAYGQDRGTAR